MEQCLEPAGWCPPPHTPFTHVAHRERGAALPQLWKTEAGWPCPVVNWKECWFRTQNMWCDWASPSPALGRGKGSLVSCTAPALWNLDRGRCCPPCPGCRRAGRSLITYSRTTSLAKAPSPHAVTQVPLPPLLCQKPPLVNHSNMPLPHPRVIWGRGIWGSGPLLLSSLDILANMGLRCHLLESFSVREGML